RRTSKPLSAAARTLSATFTKFFSPWNVPSGRNAANAPPASAKSKKYSLIPTSSLSSAPPPSPSDPPFFVLLCDLCALPSVTSVLPSLFSVAKPHSLPQPPRAILPHRALLSRQTRFSIAEFHQPGRPTTTFTRAPASLPQNPYRPRARGLGTQSAAPSPRCP